MAAQRPLPAVTPIVRARGTFHLLGEHSAKVRWANRDDADMFERGAYSDDINDENFPLIIPRGGTGEGGKRGLCKRGFTGANVTLLVAEQIGLVFRQ